MESNFIPTIATITVTLIGFVGAIFVFWYGTQKKEFIKNPELLKIHLILFSSITIIGVTILLLTSSILYYTQNGIATSISYNLFIMLVILGLIYFVMIITSVWPKNKCS